MLRVSGGLIMAAKEHRGRLEQNHNKQMLFKDRHDFFLVLVRKERSHERSLKKRRGEEKKDLSRSMSFPDFMVTLCLYKKMEISLIIYPPHLLIMTEVK
ncbi:Hypothetical predicted protein [Scomber scombrus]